MTAPVTLDALEIVELLGFVADVAGADPVSIGTALRRCLGAGYDATDLQADATRLADGLARAMGFADASLEPAP